jgi:TrmH family RNA methyltransferase
VAHQDEPIRSIKHPAVDGARRALGVIGGEEPTAFLADGLRLARRAVEAGAPVRELFFLQPAEGAEIEKLRAEANRRGVPCRRVTRGVFFKILDLGYETSVRVLAVLERPASADVRELLDADGLVLVGEQIQDPRNVGVLVRTADACGACCAMFTRDSADPWSRAAVRSSTGSIFRVPIAIAANLADYLESLKGDGLRVVGTSAHAERPCWHADLSGRVAVVLGNESVGVSDEVRAVCNDLVTIPMRGGADSFNVTVAAGMVLYERIRQAATQQQHGPQMSTG